MEELQEKVDLAQRELKEAKQTREEKIATLTSELEEAKKCGVDELLVELNKVTSLNYNTTFNGCLCIENLLVFQVYLLSLSFLGSSQRR